MNEETFRNMIASFAWGIRVEPGHPYTYPPNGRQLLINEVWLTDQSAATTQDTLVYATVGNKDPALICIVKPYDRMPVPMDLEFQLTKDVIFSVVGPGGVCLTGSYMQDLIRACRVSAKATCKDNKSQSPGDKIDEEIEAELDKETENNNDKMKLDDMGSQVLDSSKDKVNVDDEAKGKGDSLNMPVPYLAEVETTKEDRATAPSSEGLNLERESLLASAPLPLIELEGEKKREEQTNKDDMKKKSNVIGGCKGLSIRDRYNKYLDFAEICIENKWERRKRLRKDVLPVTFFGEKKRNGGKREKKREEQTNKDDMKKKSNGNGGCKGLSIRDRWNKYLDFAEICIENKWERRKRLRKDVLPVTFFGEKKRNGGKREKHESIESEFDDDVDTDGE